MELRSFIAGMLFLIGVQILMPVLGISVDVVLPYMPYSRVLLGLVALILAYYIFKSN
ncbi:MAG: hypothetical protein QW275_02545 [Candidatus Anstonellaceae archaeon]